MAGPYVFSLTPGMENPFTTLGDLVYCSGDGTPGTSARLAGNTSSSMKVLAQTGTGAISAPPTWVLPSALGVGTVTSVDVSGGTTGLTTSGGPITTSGTITLAGTLAITNGGTGGTTVATAQANLQITGRRAIADTAATVVATDKVIAYTSITTNRTVTLCAANAVPGGYEIMVQDESGSCSNTRRITVSRAGSDTINGATSVGLSSPYGLMRIISNGTSAWIAVSGSTQDGANTAWGSFAAASSNGTALGYGAVSNGGVAIGWTVTGSGAGSIIIGGNSTTATSDQTISIGQNSDATALQAIAIGKETQATGAQTIAIGFQASAITSLSCIAIGDHSSAGSTDQYCLSIGAYSSTTQVNTSVGHYAVNTGRGAQIFGTRSWNDLEHATCVGYGAESRNAVLGAVNPIIFGVNGGNVATHLYADNGWACSYNQKFDAAAVTRTPASCPFYIHAMRGLDAKDTPTLTNQAGGSLYLAGGESTGTGTSGSVYLTSAPASGSSNNTLNTPQVGLQVDPVSTTGVRAYVPSNSTFVVATTTEATTGGAGSGTFAGGVYATKAIISGSATNSTSTTTGGIIGAGGLGLASDIVQGGWHTTGAPTGGTAAKHKIGALVTGLTLALVTTQGVEYEAADGTKLYLLTAARP